MTTLVRSKAEFRTACDEARRRGERVGLVPTMGALHDGHLALIEGARSHGATFVTVTIFVNPLQFGPSEDFERYPRPIEDDVARCRERGVDLVFAPHPREMYPPGFGTNVQVRGLTDSLEGACRPGHFDGVTTVVAKLFHLAGPSIAIFGHKDYQQWLVLKAMVRDLDLPIAMHGHPIVREADGLAMSSRNRYLSPADRARARSIPAGITAARQRYAGGERDPNVLVGAVRKTIEAAADRVDYIEAVDAQTLAPVAMASDEPLLIAVAAHFGTTRLIDNAVLGEAKVREP